MVGFAVGFAVGGRVGFDVGFDVGFWVGFAVGCKVGFDVGLNVDGGADGTNVPRCCWAVGGAVDKGTQTPVRHCPLAVDPGSLQLRPSGTAPAGIGGGPMVVSSAP